MRLNNHSIFRRILRPLIFLAILNTFSLMLVIYVLRVPHQLNKNSYEICQKQVNTRQSFLQDQMNNSWADLAGLALQINSTTSAMLVENKLDLELLDSKPSECADLVLEIIDPMIRRLYRNKVSGIYIIFNTHDLEKDLLEQDPKPKTGIYIRDKDPQSASSEQYADLLLECSPAKVVQHLMLSTDSKWEQIFKFSREHPYEDWLIKTYKTASESPSLSDVDCGNWSIKGGDDGQKSLNYSMPLILPDGTVYGVLGVEILPDYLSSLLPNNELNEAGSYGLYITSPADGSEEESGILFAAQMGPDNEVFYDKITLSPNRYDGYQSTINGTTYEIGLSYLTLYNRNTPFENQRWAVLGAVPTRSLYAFSRRVITIMFVISLIVLLFGAIGAMITSWHIAKPIHGLQLELSNAKPNTIPILSKTGINEVDDFATAITSLSENVINSSKRFLSIMEMSSIDMGGYELDEQNNFVFVTENFFKLFGKEDIASSEINVRVFLAVMNEIQTQYQYEQTSEDSKLYSVRNQDGTVRYIHVQERQVENRLIGLAEDVTPQILERKYIERERDFDLLTGIYNRRAFTNRTQKLLQMPVDLGVAIAVMIDLDNLKQINDTYGHEWGDRYIVAAAQSIQKYVPEKSIYARISGDEFNILMYGFENDEQAQAAMEKIWDGFEQAEFILPDGIVRNVRASGGYTIMHDGESDIQQLIRYADFAMYRIKKENKGSFAKFNLKEYLANEIEKERHNRFRRIVREQKIYYVFQPIINAHTGNIFGYEALMRVHDSENMDLREFFSIARSENAMADIERLTWFNALPAYQRLLEQGDADQNAKLFVNSQVGHQLSADEQLQLIERFNDIRDRIVMEVVETDDLAQDFANIFPRDWETFAREYALDDYGTGYNSEKNMITLMPGYIKIDMTLIRDVDKYKERQKLIMGLLSFAHEKNILVLAEGVETMAELHCLVSMGIDLFQGFLFAKPACIPGEINQDAVLLLKQQ